MWTANHSSQLLCALTNHSWIASTNTLHCCEIRKCDFDEWRTSRHRCQMMREWMPEKNKHALKKMAHWNKLNGNRKQILSFSSRFASPFAFSLFIYNLCKQTRSKKRGIALLIKKFLWIVSPLQIMMCGVSCMCVDVLCYLFIYIRICECHECDLKTGLLLIERTFYFWQCVRANARRFRFFSFCFPVECKQKYVNLR